MDILSDLAAVQQRIAELTGTEAPAPAPPAAQAALGTAGVASAFTTYLAQLMAPPAAPALPAAMVLPVTGPVTSEFGPRENPMGGGTEFHPGIDIAADTGTPIRAAAGGVVVGVSRDPGYGNLITVDDGDGMTTRYAHCSQIFARVGETVAPGDVIGAVGMTGRATGPHLHFEVRQDDQPVDPRRFLPPV